MKCPKRDGKDRKPVLCSSAAIFWVTFLVVPRTMQAFYDMVHAEYREIAADKEDALLFQSAYSAVTMTASLDSLPAELLTLILEHAQHNDTQWSVNGQSIDTSLQQQCLVQASSVLQTSRTSRRLYTASMSVLYETINLTRVQSQHRLPLVHQLAQCPYGRCVRSLSLKVALGSATSYSCATQQDTVTSQQQQQQQQQQQALLDCNDALSIGQTVFILDRLPYLTSLQVELVNALPGTYISRLPIPLKTVLRRHGRYLTHFGITSAQLTQDGNTQSVTSTDENFGLVPPTACPYFQLDEQLVADAISVLPNLRSISLDQTSYDTLSSTSPLYESISSLVHLRRLDILNMSTFSDKWMNRALSGPLEYLSVVSDSGALPHSFDTFIHLHRKTLKQLSLVGSPSLAQPQFLPAVFPSTQRYSLPLLEALEIDANFLESGSVSYLERYTNCPRLKRITIRNAIRISMQYIKDRITQKRFKSLKMLEIRLEDGILESDEEEVDSLRNVAEIVGVNLRITTR